MANKKRKSIFLPKKNLFLYGSLLNTNPILTALNLSGLGTNGSVFNIGANIGTSHPEARYGSNTGITGFTRAGGTTSVKPKAGGTGVNWNGLLSAAAPFVGNIAKDFLSNGFSTGVGETVNTVGSTVSLFLPGPWRIVGLVGSNILSGLINGATGIKWNDDTIKSILSNTSNIRNIGNQFGQADTSSSFFQTAGNMNSGRTINWRDLGSTGWLRSNDVLKDKAKELLRELNRALAYQTHSMGESADRVDNLMDDTAMANFTAFGGPLDSINPSTPIGYSIYTDKFIKDKQKLTSNMTNMFAGTPDIFGFGGGIYTKGANFDTGVSFINKGGTHEENPNDGVQMGVDSLGVPNLVEEGEVKWNDYVFSDRLTVPNYKKQYKKKTKDIPYEALVLWDTSDRTFADATKRIIKKNGEGNDPITTRGNEAQLAVLALVLEKEREKEKLREILEAIDNMSPEEFAMLQLLMEAQQAALLQQEMAMQQLQMIPEGMEQMQPIEEQQPIAALGGLLATDNQFKYGGNLDKFTLDLSEQGLTLDDYISFIKSTSGIEDTLDAILTDDTFDKNIAEQFLNRVKTISKQYSRRAKQLGIKEDSLEGSSKAQYDRDLTLAIKKGISNKDYNVNTDDLLAFNSTKITSSKDKQQSYSQIADYNDLIERGGRRVTLDDLGRPTWDNIEGLTKIDNSAEGFYNNLGDLNPDALQAKGIYDYSASTPSSISDKNNIKLYGWNLGEDGNYLINPEDISPNKTSLNAGNTENTYPTSDLGELTYGAEGYKEALDNIQNNKDYQELTSYVLDAINAADNDYSKLPEDIQNYLEYLDTNSGNVKLKLLTKDSEGNITGIAENAASLYDRRRKDNKYGIYHYLFDKGNNAAANRYFYKDGDNKVYVSKPGEGFSIGETPEVVTGTDGTVFNDYEVTGLNKERTLTQLPTGEVVDVTDLADLPNWRKLDKPVLVDNKDNLGYGINGTTGWVDYTSSPKGLKIDTKNDPFPRAASWPYAIAAGLLLGSLGYNILKPADYSNADALLNASKDAGIFRPVNFRPIGNYLTYRPDDPWFYTSPIMALANATQRAISNRITPSKGAEMIANNYNTMLALGQAQRLQLDNNFNKYAKVGEFNKDTDKFNSEGFLKEDMANQDAASRAAGYTLEGKRAAYAMRQAVDDAKANAINVRLSGLANLAYNYAGSKYNQDLLGWGMRHNAWGPGVSYKSSKWGKIRRKRGIGF